MTENKFKTIEEVKKLTREDWKNLETDDVEDILRLYGVKEIETNKDLDELMGMKKVKLHAYKKNVLVDFYAVWCGPCHYQDKMFAMQGIEILKKCFPELEIYRCDVDKTKKLDKTTRSLGIRSIPILAYLNDSVSFMNPGTKRIEQIVAFLDEHTKNKNEEEIKKILK